MAGRRTVRIAAAIGIAGAVGLGLVAVAGGAYAQPQLPPVAPEDLVSSVLTAADPGPFNGTVELDNNLGLPALPQTPRRPRTARAPPGSGPAATTSAGWRCRPTPASAPWSPTAPPTGPGTPTTARSSSGPAGAAGPHAPRPTPRPPRRRRSPICAPRSTVAVDGTATVAGRGAYELVLTPAPTERTLLREVRVAVDAEKRMPLRLTVLATGSSGPALQVGFTDLTFGPQDPALFTFTPPPGATVTDAPRARTAATQRRDSTTVGDGWDTVKIMRRPADTTPADEPDPTPPTSPTIGTPVSGTWGSGRLITTRSGPRSSPTTGASPRAPCPSRCSPTRSRR